MATVRCGFFSFRGAPIVFGASSRGAPVAIRRHDVSPSDHAAAALEGNLVLSGRHRKQADATSRLSIGRRRRAPIEHFCICLAGTAETGK